MYGIQVRFNGAREEIVVRESHDESGSVVFRCVSFDQGRIYSQQRPVQEKCGALHLGRQTLFSWKKNCRPFLLITLVHSAVAHYFGHAKIRGSFCGATFLWGPLFGRTC